MVNTLFKGRLSRMSSTGAAAAIPKTVEVKSVSHGMNFTLLCCYMCRTLQSVTKLMYVHRRSKEGLGALICDAS